MPDNAHNEVARSIDQEREEEIHQLAEDRATDDADSLYPFAEESESVLKAWGRRIAREFGFADEELEFFASAYASLYAAEIDCLDLDYESENEEENGFIMARRIRMADLDPLAIFFLQTPSAERHYQTYQQARRAYNACRRTNRGAKLSLVRYVDANHAYRRDCTSLFACGSFKWEEA